MDFIDRIQLCVRYNLLAFLCLIGKEDTHFFDNQLRKVHYILTTSLVDDESDEEVQSEESSTCGVVEDNFQCIDNIQNDESVGNGESPEEAESSGPVGEESDGCEDNN